MATATPTISAARFASDLHTPCHLSQGLTLSTASLVLFVSISKLESIFRSSLFPSI